MVRRTYESRLEKCENPLLKKLFKIIIEKKTNLCVAADVETIERLEKLLDCVAEHICILKIHADSFDVGRAILFDMIKRFQQKHNFLLFVDRKFHEGPNSIQMIYKRYAAYADIVTIWPESDDDIMALETGAGNIDEPRGCFAVCETSFTKKLEKNTFLPSLVASVESFVRNFQMKRRLEVAERNSFCVGIIAQTLNVSDEDNMIKVSPGVHLNKSGDQYTQRWRDPKAVVESGADVIVVGRGIVAEPEDKWAETAKLYKNISYDAYLEATTKTK